MKRHVSNETTPVPFNCFECFGTEFEVIKIRNGGDRFLALIQCKYCGRKCDAEYTLTGYWE